MLQTVQGPWGFLNMYDLCNSIGSILGVGVLLILLRKDRKRQWKEILLGFGLAVLVVVIGGYLSSLVRQLTHYDYDTIHTLLDRVRRREGNHFIGRVLALTVLYPIGFRVGAIIFHQRKQIPLIERTYLNDVSFYIVIQHFFNRLACLLKGCCYGIPYKGMLAIRFPLGEPAYPVFPVQGIEMLGMVILLFLMIIRRRKGKALFGLTVVGFSLCIFISEFFMDKRGTVLYDGNSAIQIVSIVLFLGGILHIWYEKKEGFHEANAFSGKSNGTD